MMSTTPAVTTDGRLSDADPSSTVQGQSDAEELQNHSTVQQSDVTGNELSYLGYVPESFDGFSTKSPLIRAI
jgi:hypothetical protein